MDRGEGESSFAACQEGCCRGFLLLHEAVEAILLGLVADDGAEEGHESGLIPCVGREGDLSILKSAENDVGEGVGEGDSGEKVFHREGVFAGPQGGLTTGFEETVGAKGVEFFLLMDRLGWTVEIEDRSKATYCDDSLKRFYDIIAIQGTKISRTVAVDIVGDVVEEL